MQKTILSASFLKQPTLCDQLINKYVEFTNKLATVTVQTAKPLEVTLFQVQDFDMTTIDENGTFKPIKICNVQAQNNILMANAQILSHVCIEMVNLEKELVVKCVKCLLNTFINGHLRVKSKCLRFFTTFFRHTLTLDDRLQYLIVQILECLNEISDRISLWIHHKLIKNDDIEKFTKAVNSFLNSPSIVKLFNATSLCGAVNACLKLIQTNNKIRAPAYENIIPSVYDFLRTISAEVGDELLYQNISELVTSTIHENGVQFHRCIELLGVVVLDEMKSGKIQLWSLIDDKLNEMINKSNQTAQMIVEQLMSLQSILKIAQYLEHNLTIHLQRNHCNRCKIDGTSTDLATDLRKVFNKYMNQNPRRLFPNLDKIGNWVLNNFSQLLTTKYNPLVDTTTLLLFTDIAIGILSIYDAQEIDDYLQSNLLLIALCPFVRCSELLFNHFQQAFERETVRINKIMESPFVRDGADVSWQTIALQSIVKLNLEYISTKNKDIYMDFLGQIFNKVNQSDYLDGVINVLVSCVIQVNTYGIQELEKYLDTIAHTATNHLVVSHHLGDFYCLSSGDAHIFQIMKDDVMHYKIICPTCQIHLQSDLDAANLLQNLLEKTNGKYVRTLKTDYKIRADQHAKYFRFFMSREREIRITMTFVLPSILNHLDMEKFHGVVECCLNLLVDNEMEIRLGMAKHINLFPKRCDSAILKKCQEKLLKCTQKFLMSDQKSDQSYAVQLISSFATADGVSEQMLLNCFRMILYYCMSSMSMVSRQAALCATEMCYKFGITPKNLLIWYKTDIFKLIVTLCAANYTSYNIGLQKSTNAVRSN